MTIRRALLPLLLCFCLLPLSPWVSANPTEFEEASIPTLHRHVTDMTQTLSPTAQETLEQQLSELTHQKGVQIAILVVPSTRPEPIEDYAQRVFEAWKLGRKGIDDGLLIVVAKNDRHLRVHVGYGLEGTITDLQAKQISREIISPAFKLGDYEGGLARGVEAFVALINGDSTLPGVTAAAEDDIPVTSLGLIAFDMLLAPFLATRLVRKRWRPAWLPGGPLLPLLIALGTAGLYCIIVAPAGLVTLPFMGMGVVVVNRFLADRFDPQAREQRLAQRAQQRRRGPFDAYTTGGIGSSNGGFSGGLGSGGSDFGGGGGDSGGGGASDSW